MSTYVIFEKPLTCVYDEVLKDGNDLCFYRYGDTARFHKTPKVISRARSLQNFLKRIYKESPLKGHVYELEKNNKLTYKLAITPRRVTFMSTGKWIAPATAILMLANEK